MKQNVECKDAFKSHEEYSIFPVAELINNRNCGKLIYPSKYMSTIQIFLQSYKLLSIYKSLKCLNDGKCMVDYLRTQEVPRITFEYFKDF